jgi:hypothetical protein
MIKWNEKFSEHLWAETSNQVLVVGLLDCPGYDPTAKSTLLLLDSFGMPDPLLSTGWDSNYKTCLSTPQNEMHEKIPGLSGKYDTSKNYPLAFIRLGEITNGDYSEIDSLLIPIRKVQYWTEITQAMIEALEWNTLDWDKSTSDDPSDFYPAHRSNGVWIGKLTSGDIVLNLSQAEDGEQWYFSTESNVAKVYGIDSHTEYRDRRLTSVAFLEYPQSNADRVSFVA